MKKRMQFYLICGLISSIISMAMGIAGYITDIDNNINILSSSLILFGSLVTLIGSVISYLYHDRHGGLIMLFGVLLTGFGSMIGYLVFDLWLSLCLTVSFNAGLLGIVVSIFRLKINQNVFDNKIFGDITKGSLVSLIVSVITSFIIVVEVVLCFSQELVISGVVLIITLLFVLCGEVISYFGLSRFGSLLLTSGVINAFILVNYFEIIMFTTTTLFLIVIYILLSVLLWAEWVRKVEEGIEVQIGPKEYIGD